MFNAVIISFVNDLTAEFEDTRLASFVHKYYAEILIAVMCFFDL